VGLRDRPGEQPGTVWYALTQGDGVRQTVDTGPALANPEGQLGWRTVDGAFHHLRLLRTGETIRRLVADPAGGVWFVANAIP
jgi:hypothetical protein